MRLHTPAYLQKDVALNYISIVMNKIYAQVISPFLYIIIQLYVDVSLISHHPIK